MAEKNRKAPKRHLIGVYSWGSHKTGVGASYRGRREYG